MILCVKFEVSHISNSDDVADNEKGIDVMEIKDCEKGLSLKI